jgi:hypothetical protein
VLFHSLSLLHSFFPYVPSLLFHLLSVFFNRLGLAPVPRALCHYLSGLLRFRLWPMAGHLFPCSLRPAPCGLFFFLTMALLPSPPVHSAQVTLQWDPNQEEDLAGYRIYYGTSSGDYSYSLDVGKTTTCTIANLQDGTPYYFAATAYDNDLQESEFSSEVVYPGCTFSITPQSQNFGSSGGAGTVSLSAGAGCSWTAVSNAAWILISSNANGSGSTTIYFSVASNSSSSRSGTLTVAGKPFTVNQEGSSPSFFTIRATAGANGTISPQGAVTVAAGAGQTFTMVPAAGYTVGNVKVDGTSVAAVTSYAFGNVTADHTLSVSFTPLSPSSNPSAALNAGGSAHVDRSGVQYSADRDFFGGASGRSSAAIKGTQDGALYQAQRYGNFSYAIPIADGSYDLTLKFVESEHSARNQRVFDVWVEGRLSLNHLDIYAVAGKDTALDITFTVSVSDGVLNLDFIPATGDAQVSALLIKKASGPPKNPPGKLKRYFSTQLK